MSLTMDIGQVGIMMPSTNMVHVQGGTFPSLDIMLVSSTHMVTFTVQNGVVVSFNRQNGVMVSSTNMVHVQVLNTSRQNLQVTPLRSKLSQFFLNPWTTNIKLDYVPLKLLEGSINYTSTMKKISPLLRSRHFIIHINL